MKQPRIRIAAVGLAAGLLGVGCGRQATLSSPVVQVQCAAAEILAEAVNDTVPEAGPVLLVHRQTSDDLANQWRDTFAQTLAPRFELRVFGPQDLPESAREDQGMAVIRTALEQRGDPVAIISAIPLTVEEQPPRNLPPLFAFLWPFLEDGRPWLARGILRAGIFERASYDVNARPRPGMSARETMALRFVFVSPQSLGPPAP